MLSSTALLTAALVVPALLFLVLLGIRIRKSRRHRPQATLVVLRKAPVVRLYDDAVPLADSSYGWEMGTSSGLPPVWEEDLLLRRN